MNRDTHDTENEKGLSMVPFSKTVSESIDTKNVSETMRLGREVSVTEKHGSSLPSQSQNSKKCLTCGKPFKPKNRNMTHCEEHLVQKTNDRKIPNCLWCGKKLWKGDPNAFCSNDCRRDYVLDQYSKRRKENE